MGSACCECKQSVASCSGRTGKGKRTRSFAEALDALRGHDITEVHVVGIDIDQCVFALFDAGFRAVILEDQYASASGAQRHKAGLIALKRAVGESHVRRGMGTAHEIRSEPSRKVS